MAVAAETLTFGIKRYRSPRLKTTCMLDISIDKCIVWPVREEEDAGLDIQIDDLLAYLTDFWKPLMLRQVYPIPVSPWRPSELRSEAERRWRDNPSADLVAEDKAVCRFEEAHDLAHAFPGLYGLPHFWMVRSGDHYQIDAMRRLYALPFAEVRRALSEVGDESCKILEEADKERWAEAIAAWRSRDQGDGVSLLAWSTGLERPTAERLVQEGMLVAPDNFNDAANDNDELRIAARMASALLPEQVREVINIARGFSAREAKKLRDLARATLEHIDRDHSRRLPWQEGAIAAQYVRAQLNIPSQKAVDIFSITKELGIELQHTKAEPPSLDGLAIWGSRHGPGVFLNEASPRILRTEEEDFLSSVGARVTMAHELCHLLLDGDNALSAVEILEAKMPTGVEQRAKSFAGELLLPTMVASEHWYDYKRPSTRDGLEPLVQYLVDYYGVTRSVATWKLEHAASAHGIKLTNVLDVIAPYR